MGMPWFCMPANFGVLSTALASQWTRAVVQEWGGFALRRPAAQARLAVPAGLRSCRIEGIGMHVHGRELIWGITACV